MKNKIIPALVVIALTMSSIAIAVSDEDIKIITIRALIDYLENPSAATLSLDETIDLVDFYLTTPKGEEQVNLDAIGGRTGKTIREIFNNTVLIFTEEEEEPTEQPSGQTCAGGWKCKTKFHKAYQNQNCEWEEGNWVFCENGCFNRTCKPLKQTCVDRCGNDICQEVVCLAIGCPCAETPRSCPEDCEEEDNEEELGCTDSDGGKNYYSKGKIKGHGVVAEGISGVTLTDSCLYQSNKVREFYCEGSQGAHIDYECENGCSNGSCRRSNEGD